MPVELVHFAALQVNAVLFLDKVVGDELKQDQQFMDEERYGIALRSIRHKLSKPELFLNQQLVTKPMVLERTMDLLNLVLSLKDSHESPVAQLTKIITDTEYFLCTADIAFYSREMNKLQESSFPYLKLLGAAMLALSVVCIATGLCVVPAAAGALVGGGMLCANRFFGAEPQSNACDMLVTEIINYTLADTFAEDEMASQSIPSNSR